MQIFLEACQTLVLGAPVGPYPRAQALYFAKHSLNHGDHAARCRLFIERYNLNIHDSGDWELAPTCFAIVHWEGEQLEIDAYAHELHQRWNLDPWDLLDLHLYPKPWFRDAGAYARFYVPVAVDSRSGARVITPAERPVAAAEPADPGL
jgi:hypothetical protein